MPVHFFYWVCNRCDVSPLKVRIGVSADGNLIATWRCDKCHRNIMASLPMEEVIAKVPRLQIEAPLFTKEDVSLLAGMKISVEEISNDT